MELQSLVQNSKSPLTDIEWEIYRALEQTKEGQEWTINELAMYCHASPTTIFRFCKKLGLSGFSELRAILKHSHVQTNRLRRQDFQETYHQIVDYIAGFDTSAILEGLRQSSIIYLAVQTELELRLAKDFQRIFLPFGKSIIILPNPQALTAHLGQMKQQMLIIFSVDTQEGFPIECQSPQVMSDIFCLVIGSFSTLSILRNEQILIPYVLPKEEWLPDIHITPYTLAIEMLYLKLQLT